MAVHPWDKEELDKSIIALKEESEMLGEELDEPGLARKILREGLPHAALGMVQTAIDGVDAKMRFQAQKYLLDRGLGTITEGGDFKTEEKDLFQQLLERCISERPLDET